MSNLLNIWVFIFFNFSTDDIGLKIKYQFVESSAGGAKKRKINDKIKTSILDYSSLKLPATAFCSYVKLHMANFATDCANQ